MTFAETISFTYNKITSKMIRKSLLTTVLLAASMQVFSQTLKLATAYKTDACANPILPYNLCADPTAVEYKGRLYVYGTNDQQELNTTKNTTKNTYGKINQLVCMSTADLVNWTFHGTIDVKSISGWMNCSWAPSIVSREESDGKTHFYLYYTNQASGIGMLTATSPTGPWTDPIGRALIDWSTPGRGSQSNIIDPGVCIDDEGNGWLSFGGGDPNSNGSKLMPGNARIVKLGKNMKSLASEIKEIPAPFHFEANELNFINGKFVFSYSGGWSCNSGDWSRYAGKGSYACPGNCSILMMQTDDPLNGEWKYTGEMLKNPGSFGYPWGNNHSHMQKFGEQWYMIYHTQYIEGKMGISGGYRSIALNPITVNESTVKITAPSMSNNGPGQLTANRPTSDSYIEAECIANAAGISAGKVSGASGGVAVTDIQAGDWTMIRGLKMTSEIKSVTARLKGKCTMEIRAGSINSKPIATIVSTSTAFRYYSVDLTDVIPEGKTFTYLYFVFTEASGTVQFDRYQFNALSVEETTAIGATPEADVQDGHDTYFYMNGVKQNDRPEKGLYIRQRTMPDGTRKSEKRMSR